MNDEENDGRQNLPDPGYDREAAIDDAANAGLAKKLSHEEDVERKTIPVVIFVGLALLAVLLVVVVVMLLTNDDGRGSTVDTGPDTTPVVTYESPLP